MRRATDWTNPSNGWNAVAWESEDLDTDGFWDVALPQRLTVPAALAAGVFLVVFGGHLSSLGTSPAAGIWRGSNDQCGIAPITTGGSENSFTVSAVAKRPGAGYFTCQLEKTGGTQTLDGDYGFFPSYAAITYLGEP